MSWFCNTICSTQNQNQHQLLLFNNQTQQIFGYNDKVQRSIMRKNQLKNGFILIKKSLYGQLQSSCKKQNKKFTDQSFPPNSSSLGLIKQPTRPIAWKRLSQLHPENCLIKDNISPSDIQQGNIGDCYFLAAISALSQNQSNILSIFGKNNIQNISKNNYGIYKVIMNKGGEPEQVIVDEFIPVYEKSNRPVFCKPVNGQFWVVILEKAWAKVNGSYDNISAGNPHEVLNKFSVAPVFYHNIHQYFYQNGIKKNIKETQQFQKKLWENIIQGHKQNFAMCCSTRNIVYVDGIKDCHSYTLLSAYEFMHNNKKHRILKMRNPWGNTQYTGALSQSDSIWKQISFSIKNQIFQKSQNDGIFLIPYQTFLLSFQSINICHCRQKYNYIFKGFKLNNHKNNQNKLTNANYFQLYVEEDGEVYLTFQKDYKKDYYQDKYLSNGVSKILVARQIDVVNDINNVNVYVKQYQFIDCALQTTLADVTVRCRNMKKGYYIIMVQNQSIISSSSHNNIFPSSFSLSHGTISSYSNTICSFQSIQQPYNFLYKYFSHHAICYNNDKKKIGQYEKDWICRKLLSECGYGYVVISLHENGKKKLQVVLNYKLIEEAGFQVFIQANHNNNSNNNFNNNNFNVINSKQNNKVLNVIVNPGDFIVFLFKINYQKSTQKLVFPPQGFQVKKII